MYCKQLGCLSLQTISSSLFLNFGSRYTFLMATLFPSASFARKTAPKVPIPIVEIGVYPSCDSNFVVWSVMWLCDLCVICVNWVWYVASGHSYDQNKFNFIYEPNTFACKNEQFSDVLNGRRVESISRDVINCHSYEYNSYLLMLYFLTLVHILNYYIFSLSNDIFMFFIVNNWKSWISENLN